MEMAEEISTFLNRRGPRPLALTARKFPGRLRDRLVAARSMITGDMPFFDAAYFILLPNRFRPAKKRKKIMDEFFTASKRGLKAALRPALNDDGSVVLWDKPFFVPMDCYEEFLTMMHEIVDEDQYEMRKFIAKDSAIIDAGANMGVFSVFAAQLASQGRLYAFEPSPITFRALEKNAKPYADILHCLNCGLGEATRKEILVSNTHSTMGNFFKDRAGSGSQNEFTGETVKIISLDEFVQEQQLPRLDFIKIDTEGYEANILRGAAESIKRFRPVLVMSAYHAPTDREALPKLVRSIVPDYRCQIINRGEMDLLCYPPEHPAA